MILPLILYNFVPEDCPYMANYIKMLEIMSICSAQEIRIGMVDYLTDIIDEYLEHSQISTRMTIKMLT